MSAPLVSCIVPVYNGERFLGEALESILRQAHSPLEIIVVDDGSTDGTAAVASRFAPRVTYIHQANAGPAAARNLGLARSTGEFVAFLDADDVWADEKLAVQLARFRDRPELDACVAHVQNFWIPELSAEAAQFRDHPRGQPIPGYVTAALLARRALFERIGPFDAALAHADAAEFFLRARRAGAVVELLPDVLLYRRIHTANRSKQWAAPSRDEFLRLLKKSLDEQRPGPATTPEPGS